MSKLLPYHIYFCVFSILRNDSTHVKKAQVKFSVNYSLRNEYQPPPARPAKAVSLKKICCFFCCPAPFPAILPCSDCSSK